MLKDYLKWTKETLPVEGDTDIVILEDVEVLKDMVAEGFIKKGQKYKNVTWVKITNSLVFSLKNGKCRIVYYDEKSDPKWMGEHEMPPAVTAE